MTRCSEQRESFRLDFRKNTHSSIDKGWIGQLHPHPAPSHLQYAVRK